MARGKLLRVYGEGSLVDVNLVSAQVLKWSPFSFICFGPLLLARNQESNPHPSNAKMKIQALALALALLSPAAAAQRKWTEVGVQMECQGICHSVEAGLMNDILDPICEEAKTAPPLKVAHRICQEYLRKAQHACESTCNIVGAEAVMRDGGEIDATSPLYTPALLETDKVCAEKPELTSTRQRLHSEWCNHAYVKGFEALTSQVVTDTRMMFGLPAQTNDGDSSAQEALAKEKEEALKKIEEEKRVAEELKAKEEAEKLAAEQKLAEEAKVLAEKKAAEEKKLAEEQKKLAEEKAAAVEAARLEEERVKQQEAAIEAKRIADEQAASLKAQKEAEAAEIEAAALAAAEAEITP